MSIVVCNCIGYLSANLLTAYFGYCLLFRLSHARLLSWHFDFDVASTFLFSHCLISRALVIQPIIVYCSFFANMLLQAWTPEGLIYALALLYTGSGTYRFLLEFTVFNTPCSPIVDPYIFVSVVALHLFSCFFSHIFCCRARIVFLRKGNQSLVQSASSWKCSGY